MSSSCLYTGSVRHRRETPAKHEFRYSMFMLYLDLSEVDTIFARRWLWSTKRWALARWRRADHLGDPNVPLDIAVRDLVERETGARPRGPIRLLTHPRYLGYGFNPVSFYYCFDERDECVRTIVAEVNNTPWRERHCYVLDRARDEGGAKQHRWRMQKEFHVSPFMPMDVQYDWSFSDPAGRLVAHMASSRLGQPFFDATLTLARREITGSALARALLRHPFMTTQVIVAIHWQALRLWLKRVPFHEHPRWKARASTSTR